MCTER